jgi:hypothetical protein
MPPENEEKLKKLDVKKSFLEPEQWAINDILSGYRNKYNFVKFLSTKPSDSILIRIQ